MKEKCDSANVTLKGPEQERQQRAEYLATFQSEVEELSVPIERLQQKSPERTTFSSANSSSNKPKTGLNQLA